MLGHNCLQHLYERSSSVPHLLQMQGTNNTTAHGWAVINTSTTYQTIPHNRRGLCWTIAFRLGTPHRKMITKGYIARIVCFVTKAVHIEVVTSSTTEAFLAALRRFIARRRKPKTIYSDNGTNFQGSANELHEIYKILQSTWQMAKVQDFLATEGCNWKFIPPHGPHFGRLWEAAVKSMKYHLQRTFGAHVATYKELPTLLAEIQACLYSRPLCALPSDPWTQYIISWTILIGNPLPNYLMLTSVTCNKLPRWHSTNNFNSFGKDGHPTIYRVFNSQRRQMTTRLHSIGLQLSSPTSIHIRWHRMRGHT